MAVSDDKKYMKMALELAEKGRGSTSPNPMVGAVIVKSGAVIGRGCHEKYGGPHAERNALASCSISPAGGTMYVTLEPCCHYGKQPPCVDAILRSGISRVVIGSADPNPLVRGKGMEILKSHGVDVTEGICSDECHELNHVFFHYITTRRPFVAMKYAMTSDGKITAYTGRSKWITGKKAREHAHELRHRYTGIMVGIGTVLRDDPLLTCRIEGGRDPIRIICDSGLRTPLDSQIMKTAGNIPTIIASCCGDRDRIADYEKAGCRILDIRRKGDHIDPEELMIKLAAENIDSILLEGGGTLNWSALNSGIVQRVYTYMAPKILGGADAKTPVEGPGVTGPDLGFRLKFMNMTRLDEDILIESEVIDDVHGDR